MENELAQLSINDEEDKVLQIQPDLNREGRWEIFQLVGCFLTASVIHFPVMRSTLANLSHPVWDVQIRDLGEKRLDHSDPFCEAKMTLGVEVAEMGWDLSLRA
ncbi:hypothetical protein PVK06_031452 [Gossypium arboreum]|uniref:Uncharacterized protein n=1 Tax=Gossypium arboreum TaxID=29729 RepID=A0ABR0NR55_GOSAR|nr:hypothetical protein PVK06_031452 [Gossypium arboreum]